jgi:serine/threonine protein kinase
MGEVYKARDTRLDRTVVVKVLPESFAGDLQRREARAISSLNHPHICALHDVGTQEDTAYLVMEYVVGESLAERLKRGRMEPAEALPLARQIAGALDAAHRHGIMHRDLKPANTMLGPGGAKLLDFGLARMQQAPAAEALSNLPTEGTHPGAVLGTPPYMAPEQLEGREADSRSDIFAFGCVLYEMLIGRRAFTGESPASLIAAILGSQRRRSARRSRRSHRQSNRSSASAWPRSPTTAGVVRTVCCTRWTGIRNLQRMWLPRARAFTASHRSRPPLGCWSLLSQWPSP